MISSSALISTSTGIDFTTGRTARPKLPAVLPSVDPRPIDDLAFELHPGQIGHVVADLLHPEHIDANVPGAPADVVGVALEAAVVVLLHAQRAEQRDALAVDEEVLGAGAHRVAHSDREAVAGARGALRIADDLVDTQLVAILGGAQLGEDPPALTTASGNHTHCADQHRQVLAAQPPIRPGRPARRTVAVQRRVEHQRDAVGEHEAVTRAGRQVAGGVGRGRRLSSDGGGCGMRWSTRRDIPVLGQQTLAGAVGRHCRPPGSAQRMRRALRNG
jgi:hypothetical protein